MKEDDESKGLKDSYFKSEYGVNLRGSGTITIANTGTIGTTQSNIPYTGGTTDSFPPITTTPSNFEDYLKNYNQGIIYNDGVTGGIAQAQISYTNRDMKELRDTPMYDTILLDYSELLVAHLRHRNRLITNLETAPHLAWDNQVNVTADILLRSIATAWGHGYPSFKSVRVFSDGTFEIIAMI